MHLTAQVQGMVFIAITISIDNNHTGTCHSLVLAAKLGLEPVLAPALETRLRNSSHIFGTEL